MHVDFDPHSPISPQVSFEQFLAIDMRIGEIVEAWEFPEARNPSYKLTVDFGDGIGRKKSAAQITDLYTTRDLIGKKVVAVVNFPPRQIGKYMSEVLVMGFADKAGRIVLFDLDREVPNGARLH
jgi:tRNA-binding protein